MNSTDPTTVIVPFDFGTAAKFDQSIFPLAYYEEDGDFNKGSFLIRATLKEMQTIRDLGIDLNQNQEFVFNTRLRVEA